MASERIQRQIDHLLDEAGAAVRRSDWAVALDRARNVLAFDPDNSKALAYLTAADRALGGVSEPSAESDTRPKGPSDAPSEALPAAFGGGRYMVRELLGEGGSKRVYLVHDTLLDRDVAFALFRTERLDATGRQRILREAQTMGRLGDHPNIVQLYDLGEESGQPYMVLPVMGSDVQSVVESASEHRLPLERTLSIAKDVCRGLDFAHSNGVVHRDLKPSNVWLARDGTASIGDFGLAMATDRSRITQEGMMVGTVSYIPPEQAMGGEVTPRADLYSLGAMLYEMVTGRPPFVGDDNVAIIGQHINTPPVSPTWHNSECPVQLEALILRLLAKDPSERPESAAEVLTALESVDLSADVVALDASGPLPETPAAGQDPLYGRTFVGRDAELAQLHQGFDRAMSGEGSLVMVVGEPGIGKTSLCEQLSTYVALRGGVTLVGHCYEEGSLSLPYLAFVEAMRSYVLSSEAADLKKQLGSGASEVARIVSEVRERVQVEPSGPSDPDQDRYLLLQAVVSFLRNASTVQPLMIMLEDLHDADGGTLDMLSHVSRNLAGSRLLIVGTYRDVEVDRSHPLSGALAKLRRGSAFGRIHLRGLTIDEVHHMLANLSDQEIPLEASEAVHRQTEGNPLFIQEVLRYLVEEGLIRRESGGWHGTGGQPLAMSIPEGLRDVIGKRLTRLSDECNRFLAIAAVVGRDFRLDVLQRLTDMSEEDLFTVLEEAMSIGVVEERVVGAVVSYRFTHAFFRQTLYEETIAPRRIRLHQQVARVLEDVYSRRLDEHSAELAEHFSYSSDSDDLTKAVRYGEMAAERAMSVYAYGEASRLLQQALQVQEVLDPDDKARRCDLLLSLGEALMPAGEPQRVMDSIAPEAFTLAEAVSDRDRASRASRLAIDANFRYGVPSAAEHVQWVERADRYAEPDTTERVLTDIRLARLRANQGKLTEARALTLRALELARKLEDHETLYRAARGFLYIQPSPRHEEERLQLVREMSAQSQAGVIAATLGTWLGDGAGVLIAWGDRAGAEAMWEQHSQLAQRTSDAALVVNSLVAGPKLAYLDGGLDEAVSGAKDLTRTAEELGSPVRGRRFAAAASWRPLLYLGRGEEALSEAAELAGSETAMGEGVRTGILIRAHLGQTAEAGDDLRSLLAEPRLAFEDENFPTTTLVQVLEAAVLVGDRDLCSVLAERLAPAAHLSTASWGVNLTCPARHLGAAAALLDEPDKARKHYHQALEAAGKIRFRPEIALTHLQLSELLLDHYPDERTEALEHLDFAIGELRDMKMQPSLERAFSHRDILKA